MRTLISMASLVLLGALARGDDALPPELQEVGIDQNLGEQIPLDLPFRDDSGHDVKLGDYFGDKPVILVLAYYRCPMLCTQVLNGLADALKKPAFRLRLGQDFHIVTVSFDARERHPKSRRSRGLAGGGFGGVGRSRRSGGRSHRGRRRGSYRSRRRRRGSRRRRLFGNDRGRAFDSA